MNIGIKLVSVKWIVAVVLCLIAGVATAEQGLKLAAPFVDGAVLQRGMAVPVWGWGEAGADISVEFAGQKKSGKVGEDGKWRVDLDPLEANAEPGALKVSLRLAGAVEVIQVGDVLVGEVWVASGQSNMQWLASKCDVGRVLQAGIASRVEAGEERPPIIREAAVTDVFSAIHPIEHATVEWIDDAGQMSGIAYAFAYDLWRELGVPIGILNCSFSSTAIEAWTPREGFAGSDLAYTQSVYQQVLETDPATPEHKAAWGKFYADSESGIAANDALLKNGEDPEPIAIKPPGNTSGNRDASWLYNARMHPVVPYAVRGAIWNQGYANIGGGINYYANLHSLVRGWRMAWGRPDLPVYFHQFYSAGNADGENYPSFDPSSEMRTGTAMARDIPNAGMASQIDIGGGIHYYRKSLPGQRLALHALKNQYGKDIAADGPFFKSYEVKGSKLILSLDHAEGGLFIGQVETDSKLPAVVKPIENGEAQVALFFLAGADRVWHRAACKIVGDKIELTAEGVDQPRGVSYGTGGIGFQPNIYNIAKLPLTPFTAYDNKIVTKADWPDDPIKIAGYEPDPGESGLQNEFRKMPLLSTQFRDNAVLQHGMPVKVWGSAIHDWGMGRHRALVGDGEEVIKFSFGDVEKTVEVKPGMKKWSVTLDPMQPTAEGRTLAARYYIDGELIHERIAQNVVVGDVWFVAAPAMKIEPSKIELGDGIVRVIKRQAKRDKHTRVSPFSVAVSTTPAPDNRFASYWYDTKADDLAGQIAHRIASEVDYPVGVIFMQSNADKEGRDAPLKSWLPFAALADAPSLAADYAKLGAGYPGSPTYNANIRRYVDDWKTYWSDYVPTMIAQRRVPDGAPWGQMPQAMSSEDKSEATQCYNVMVHSFMPTALKGVVFIAGPSTFKGVDPADAASQVGVLRESWAKRFGGSPSFGAIVLGDAGADLKGLGWASTTYLSEFKTDERSGVPVVGGALLTAIGQAVAPAYGGVKAE